MNTPRTCCLLFTSLLLSNACTTSGEVEDEDTPSLDAGTDAGQTAVDAAFPRDAGGDDDAAHAPDAAQNVVDSGVDRDAGGDGGSVLSDASVSTDAGHDGGTVFPDASALVDGGVPVDASAPADAAHVSDAGLTIDDGGANAADAAATPDASHPAEFTLLDSNAQTELRPLRDGDTIALDLLGGHNVDIRLETTLTPTSVIFTLDNDAFPADDDAPFTLTGEDVGGVAHAWWRPSIGSHTLVAEMFAGASGTGTQLGVATVQFNVVDNGTPPVASRTPRADFTASSEIGRVGYPVELTDTSTHDPAQWKWVMRDSDSRALIAMTAARNFTYAFKTRGAVDVTLTVTNAMGQSSVKRHRIITVLPSTQPEDVTARGNRIINVTLNQDQDFQSYNYGARFSGTSTAPPTWNPSVQPGDVIVLQLAAGATSAKRATFTDLIGTAEKPIIITTRQVVRFNGSNPQASGAITLTGCTHVIIDGKGTDAEYGIEVENGSRGIMTGNDNYYGRADERDASTADDRQGVTDNVEVVGVWVKSCSGIGFSMKNVPYTDKPLAQRNNERGLELDNLRLHHNRIEQSGEEAMYIGWTRYRREDAYTPALNSFAQSNRWLRIYRNRIQNVGNDAIQPGCADTDPQIHDNVIINPGTRDDPNHDACMSVNGGFGFLSAAKIFNNVCWANNGSKAGHIFPDSHLYLWNNLLVTPSDVNGVLMSVERPLGDAPHPSLRIHVFHNTVLAYNTRALFWLEKRDATRQVDHVLFANNLLLSNQPSRLFSYTDVNGQLEVPSSWSVSGNLAVALAAISTVQFAGYDQVSGWDARVSAGSPALANNGLDLDTQLPTDGTDGIYRDDVLRDMSGYLGHSRNFGCHGAEALP